MGAAGPGAAEAARGARREAQRDSDVPRRGLGKRAMLRVQRLVPR